MSITSLQIWTYTLSNDTIVIDDTYGLMVLSILVTSGSATITGSSQANGTPSDAVALSEGQGLTVSVGENTRLVLTGITIATTGVVVLSGR